MAVIMFGAICRYNDVSRLRWRNPKFEQNGICFHLNFEKRKNARFRQGNRVTVAAAPQGQVYPLNLLRIMQLYTGGEEGDFMFRSFNVRMAKKIPERTSPGDDYIAYGQFSTFLALWFGGVMGLSPEEFLSQYGSQSGRSGATSAASNAIIPLELWGNMGIGSPRQLAAAI